MTQKHFVIIFLVVTVIAVGSILFSKFFNTSNTAVSPSPSSSTISNPANTQDSPNESSMAAKPQTKSKQYPEAPKELSMSELKNKKAVIETDKGNIEFEIYTDVPKTASNFIFLANDKFYDGLTFHRVEDWVIQGGDPTGTGRGGPGYKFEDEKVTRSYTKGTVAMANSGANTNGSQFFILTKDTPLPPNYTIFGKVTKGLDVITKIAVGDKINTVTIAAIK